MQWRALTSEPIDCSGGPSLAGKALSDGLSLSFALFPGWRCHPLRFHGGGNMWPRRLAIKQHHDAGARAEYQRTERFLHAE